MKAGMGLRDTMQIYLPIAEVSVNAFLLLGLGGLVGVLSGMFGVGGGFLMTPLLFFIGIPPAVAVATEANQIVASSFSGVLAHLRRKTVDLRMGTVLLIGGLVGAGIGVILFNYLKSLGQVDLLVKLCYVAFLGVIGGMMFVESLRAIRKSRSGKSVPTRKKHGWVHGLPFKMRFRTSGLYISVIPPLIVGVLVGILAAIMGVGGGFIMVPAMIYLLGMPTKVVVGTSLFQIIFVTGFATLMHATTNFTVDMVLAVLLLVGGVVGAQIGARIGVYLKAEQLRVLLAIMVLAVCGKLAFDLLVMPAELIRWARRGRRIDPRGTDTAGLDGPERAGGGGNGCRGAEPRRDLDYHEFRRLGDPDIRRRQPHGPTAAGQRAARDRDGRGPAEAGNGAAQGAAVRHLGQYGRDRRRCRADLLRGGLHVGVRPGHHGDRGSAPARLDPHGHQGRRHQCGGPGQFHPGARANPHGRGPLSVQRGRGDVARPDALRHLDPAAGEPGRGGLSHTDLPDPRRRSDRRLFAEHHRPQGRAGALDLQPRPRAAAGLRDPVACHRDRGGLAGLGGVPVSQGVSAARGIEPRAALLPPAGAFSER